MTTDTAYDPYALSSGLIDDFDGTVTEAYFGYDAAYNNGETVLLILELATDDIDRPQETLKLSTGTGWVIEDGGRRIVSENGKPRAFNKNSVVGHFLSCALESGAGDTMRAKGTPMEAATWQGLGFHFNRVDVVGFNGETKERLVPTKFNGGAAGASAGQAASNPASSAGAQTDVAPGLVAKLNLLAKQNDDVDSFMTAAFSDEQIANDLGACGLVTVEFYNNARG